LGFVWGLERKFLGRNFYSALFIISALIILILERSGKF